MQESFLFFINLLSVVRLYPSISVRRSAGYKAHLKLMVDIYPSQTEDGWHALIIFFISKPLNLKTFHPRPFSSYLSEFSVVSHENCTIGKLTLSSIQPHKAMLSLRPSRLTRALSKSHPISSNSAPPFSVISQWVFSCFSWKLHHWKAHITLY